MKPISMLLLIVVILTACSTPSQRPAELTAALPSATITPLHSTRTPSPSLAPTTKDPDLAAMLQIFPLQKGARWFYTREEYTQTGDPNQIVSGVFSIEDSVVDVTNQPPYYLAHIQRTVTLNRQDAGWDLTSSQFQPGQSEFWYLLVAGRVYHADALPDLADPRIDLLLEELDLPLAQGMHWCPQKQLDAAASTEPTPTPCQFVGMRQVVAVGPVQSQSGIYDTCYQMSDAYNGGAPQRWFCDGVGFVSQEFRHAGTIFGSKQELVQFIPASAQPEAGSSSAAPPRWKQYEQILAKAILGADTYPSHKPENGLCEWEVYGHAAQEVYLWAICQDGESDQGTAGSMPAILVLDEKGGILRVDIPPELLGDFLSRFPVEIRPRVQQSSPAYTFDSQAAMAHIAQRRADPSLPPLIASSTQPLP